MGDMPMAVEFRNASWWTERNRASTLAFEREHGLVNVVVDGPQGVGNTVPPVWEVTSPRLAVVRMHGRNHETWNRKGLKAASDRFNYDYSEQELSEIAGHVVQLAREVPVVHAMMNNNYEDQGQRNAKTLTGLLSGRRPDSEPSSAGCVGSEFDVGFEWPCACCNAGTGGTAAKQTQPQLPRM